MNEISVAAKLENMQKVLDFISEELEKIGCSMKSQMQLALVAEEIYVNIVNYAYQAELGKATVKIETENDPLKVIIQFVDSGIPYNPLERTDPDITLSADEREIGGLGVYLTKKLTDNVGYEYIDGMNVLTLEKYC